MARRWGIAVAAACVWVLASTDEGRAQTPAPADTPKFESGTEAVALDLVVRDKKGRLVTDLRPDEVAVLEDGVPQKLTSFRTTATAAAEGAAAAPAAAPPAASAGGPPAEPAAPRRFVLAFGRLTADGRRLAQSAGDEFAKKHVVAPVDVSVVRVDPVLSAVLDGSADPAAVREAVRQATALVAGGKERAGGPVGKETGYAASQVGRFEGGAGVNDLAQADNVAVLHALLKIVDSLERERGRKTVLFFTEGFAVAPGYEHVFSNLQSRANRANVSFYAIDVRGLQIATQLGSSGQALSDTAALSAQQRLSGSGENPATRAEVTQDDTLQTSFRSDLMAALLHLSNGTGGFLVSETNDFSRALLRIAEDSRGYYEAAYTPAVPGTPGQFRRIDVRVARKDVRVQARSGYFANPAALATAFASRDLPQDFALRSAFYRFERQGAGAFDCLVKVEASLDKAEFRDDPAKGRLAGKMVLAGRVLDGRGETVDTFGQEIGLGGTAEQVQAVRGQVLPLARRLRLAPGVYTVELLVRDAVGNHASGQRFEVTVPAADAELAMSSLVLVSTVEAADPKSDPTDPLRIGDKRIIPNVPHRVSASPSGALPIYYVVYVKPRSTTTVTGLVEVTGGDGQVVARGQAALPAPDERGRIVGLSPIPLQKLPPGTYKVRVTVSADKHQAEETTTVTVS